MSESRHGDQDEYARYKYVIENVKDVIWEMDPNMVFTFVSPTLKAMSGYTPEEMIGRCILDFLVPESKSRLKGKWNRAISKRLEGSLKSTVLYDVEMICKDGSTIWCEVSVKPVFGERGFSGYIGTTRDVSEKRKYLEELKCKNQQLEDLLTLDILTGAFNRRKFEYFVGQEIEKKEKYGSTFSIIIFDVDDFKKINDYSGHKKGDEVLRDITSLLKVTLRATDKLFRWGGDEFIILLPELALKYATKVAQKVREKIAAYDFGTAGQGTTVSLGVGEYAENENQDQFVNRVDHALLKAKFGGKNKVEQA
jgi:diguanylate cyclase (GGDEF)-like protein/PAS domain S-box-containing protein